MNSRFVLIVILLPLIAYGRSIPADPEDSAEMPVENNAKAAPETSVKTLITADALLTEKKQMPSATDKLEPSPVVSNGLKATDDNSALRTEDTDSAEMAAKNNAVAATKTSDALLTEKQPEPSAADKLEPSPVVSRKNLNGQKATDNNSALRTEDTDSTEITAENNAVAVTKSSDTLLTEKQEPSPADKLEPSSIDQKATDDNSALRTVDTDSTEITAQNNAVAATKTSDALLTEKQQAPSDADKLEASPVVSRENSNGPKATDDNSPLRTEDTDSTEITAENNAVAATKTSDALLTEKQQEPSAADKLETSPVVSRKNSNGQKAIYDNSALRTEITAENNAVSATKTSDALLNEKQQEPSGADKLETSPVLSRRNSNGIKLRTEDTDAAASDAAASDETASDETAGAGGETEPKSGDEMEAKSSAGKMTAFGTISLIIFSFSLRQVL